MPRKARRGKAPWRKSGKVLECSGFMDEQKIKELADAIYADKVRRARAMPPSKKMGLGADLFAEVCGRMRAGIRSQFPEASASEIEGILRKRLDRLSAIEDAGIFRKVESP